MKTEKSEQLFDKINNCIPIEASFNDTAEQASDKMIRDNLATKKIVEIAEDFAIGFAEWISERTTTLGGGLWITGENKLFVHKNQLLEIYKKENEL